MEVREINFDEEIISYIKKDSSRKDTLFEKNNPRISQNTYFQDDCWDFNNKNTLDKPAFLYRYDFSNIDYRYKDYIKTIVIDLLIIKNKSASTTRGNYFSGIKNFILYLQEADIYIPNRITKNIVEEYFLKHNWGERTKDGQRAFISAFLSEIERKNSDVNYKEIYNWLNERNAQNRLAEIENGKTKIIPSNLFDTMMSIAIKEIQDSTISTKDKYIACMIVILGETGMRIGEFVRLEKDKNQTLKIDEEHTLDYLGFITYKTIKNKTTQYEWTETFLNDKSKLAYDTMNKLATNKSSKYVFHTREDNLNPCDESVARYYISRFILRHYKELELDKFEDIKDLNRIKITKEMISCIGIEYKSMIGTQIYNITPHQFRVTVCTRLYDKGVSLEFIRKHMNHLSEDMTAHYIRTKKMNEKKLQAKDFIKSRIDSQGKFIETNIENVQDERFKKELEKDDIREEYEAINTFLKKGKFKILKDLDQIIDVLMITNTPLTETPEGYCARNALAKLCARQEYVSSLNNLHVIGTYIPALEFVHNTYNLFKDKVKIIKHNKEIVNKNPVYKVEYSRELKALKYFIDKRFLPEMELVENIIKKIGIEDTISKYPNLKDIIPNIDSINKEINVWIQ